MKRSRDPYREVVTNAQTRTLHDCLCGWKREVTTRRELLEIRRPHPLWGVVTPLEAAKLDIGAHQCEHYFRAALRAREVCHA